MEKLHIYKSKYLFFFINKVRFYIYKMKYIIIKNFKYKKKDLRLEDNNYYKIYCEVFMF